MNCPNPSGHSVRCLIALAVALGLVALSPFLGGPSASASVPSGFTDSAVTSVNQPTDIAFTSTGIMLITSQSGVLYKYSGGTRTTILNISGKVCSNFERGLLGVTADPAFASNGYIYLFYTYKKNGNCDYNQPTSPVNRVSRWVLSGSTVSGEKVLVDNMPSPNGNHNAGGILIGKDGYLYIAIGDGGCEIGTPGECGGDNDNARVKNRLQGKILRVSRSSGVAPTSNPFYSTGGTCRATGSTTAGLHCKETYAWGFRNPFRIAADPNSSGTSINVNDVGQNTWEEIDRLVKGADYGWNNCEGSYQNGSSSTKCQFGSTDPIYEYFSGPDCNSITGGAFIPNGAWSTTYNGAYFFSDYTCGTIWTLKNGSRATFASNLGAVTELEFGPYNNNTALYYANYGSSQIRRISFNAAGNDPPVADIQAAPTYGELPLEVSFDARGSSDPDGDSLTYQWDFGDSTSSTSSHPNKTFTQEKNYTVSVQVSDGKGGTDTDSVTIRAGSTRPTAMILSPAADHKFSVGETITLTGEGTDIEDGTLAPGRMTWEVLIHHDTHTHPFFGPTTGNNLTFKAPAPEDLAAATNSYLEIRLTVRDSSGLGKTATLNLMPNIVDVQVGSNVPGMLLWVEGVPFIAPVIVQTWEGNSLTLMAPDQIAPNDDPYIYKSWSDGGRRTHNYIAPDTDSTVEATFNPLPGDQYAAHADARVAEGYPDRNEGGGTGLSVKGGAGADYETVIRFKLSGVGETIYRARLYLYAYDPTSDGPSIYETTPSWSELGVTWNNRPGPVGSQLDNYGPIADNSWIAYDVAGAIDGNGYVAFIIRGSSSDGVSWYSRQAGAHQPRLVVWSSTPPAPAAVPTETASPKPTPTEPVVDATPVATPIATDVPVETPAASPDPEPVIPLDEQFETDLSSWTNQGATLVPGEGIDGSQALRLASSGDAVTAGEPSFVQINFGADEPSIYVSFDVNAPVLDPNGTRLATIGGVDGSGIAALYLLQDGRIGVRIGAEDNLRVLTTIDPPVWNHLEFAISGSGAKTAVNLWVNGLHAGEVVADAASWNARSLALGGWATDRTWQLLIDNLNIDRGCTGNCPSPIPADPTAVPGDLAPATPVGG